MMQWRRRAILLGAGVVAAASPATGEAQSSDPTSTVQKLYDALQNVMRAGASTPFATRFDTLAPTVDNVFDLSAILKASVGIKWEAMSPEAQRKLEQAYRRFSVATYVANFDKSDGETFRVLPDVRQAGNDRIVASEIVSRNGDRTRLDYLMRHESASWRAVDVLLDGSISRVAVQRSDFRKVLRSGDADALLAMLQKKIADLSGGALGS
jgi:phospholipid transport system substrate-binding protein